MTKQEHLNRERVIDDFVAILGSTANYSTAEALTKMDETGWAALGELSGRRGYVPSRTTRDAVVAQLAFLERFSAPARCGVCGSQVVGGDCECPVFDRL